MSGGSHRDNEFELGEFSYREVEMLEEFGSMLEEHGQTTELPARVMHRSQDEHGNQYRSTV